MAAVIGATHPDGTAAGPVPGGWTALLSLASLGLWMGYFGPLQVLLPDQIEDIAGAQKTTALGLGFGVYLSVDQALITQVLPTAEDRAKDLGVINIANSAPQVLGPALAAPIVAYLGGYTTLFAAVAAVTAAGSVLVTRIRSVA